MSHPAWVRGLKLVIEHEYAQQRQVAPCVGAWIETMKMPCGLHFPDVAPCVGAWIETVDVENYINKGSSHPAWVRGLKQRSGVFGVLGFWSHPAWVRGLKLSAIAGAIGGASRTLRGCVD